MEMKNTPRGVKKILAALADSIGPANIVNSQNSTEAHCLFYGPELSIFIVFHQEYKLLVKIYQEDKFTSKIIPIRLIIIFISF